VTGAIALLWSIFPRATATEMKLAITQAYSRPRAAVAPLAARCLGDIHIL
jgi:hypothetical protein